MAVKRDKRFVVMASFEGVFLAAELALTRTVRAKITESNETQGRIQAKTDMTFKSAGELIAVQIEQIGVQQCEVSITSQSKLWTTLLDWGKNKENIDLFEQDLRLTLKSLRKSHKV